MSKSGTDFGDAGHPLEMIEAMAAANHWKIEESTGDDVRIACQGPWQVYRLRFHWDAERSALRFYCGAPRRVPGYRRSAFAEMAMHINEHLWLGHFFLSHEDGTPTFHHTLVLSGTDGITAEQLVDIVETAISEQDRAYPAFQLIIDGKPVEEALMASLLETVGEA
ncbi:MAG TPA: YbjN domain-containing protein [Dongiaceae bacterium]|jgi:hypothetical protein|nr:YbjN domain-containing protein [Dongiaceae bacterium]